MEAVLEYWELIAGVVGLVVVPLLTKWLGAKRTAAIRAAAVKLVETRIAEEKAKKEASRTAGHGEGS